MRTKTLMIAALLISATIAPAQDDVITGYAGNGSITWTNSHTDGVFIVEWASQLDGPWQSSWTGLCNLVATGETFISSVPMFYRILWSTNTTDLQITPSEATLDHNGAMVALKATGGDGSYTWTVSDATKGTVSPGTGNAVLYHRNTAGDNAATVESGGRLAHAVMQQP